MHRTRTVSGLLASAVALATAAALAVPAEAKKPKPPPPPLTGHILAFNDLHGQLDPPVGSGGLLNGIPAGGVEYLATYVKQRRALAKASSSAVFTVAGGDTVGSSPLVSAAFHDEPMIEQLNAFGVTLAGIGDKDLDEGVAELRRLQKGGCHPVDGCQDGDGFAGAKYPMLAANIVSKKARLPVFAPFVVKKVGQVPVAFVGITLKDTPTLVNPAGVSQVTFLDEAATANTYAKALKKLGVRAMVLVLHQGGTQSPPPTPLDPNGCANFTGAVSGVVSQLDPAYGIVLTGHTHRSYVCSLPNASGASSLVTAADAFGRVLTDVTFQVDQKTRKFVSTNAQNIVVANGIQNPDGSWATDANGLLLRNPALVDPAAKVIADKYRAAVAPLANRVLGSITADVPRDAGPSGESPLGDLVADALLAHTQASGAQMAFINPGALRGSLIFANSPGGEAPGQVTYGELFTVLPFNRLVETVTMTGAQVDALLEQQFAGHDGQTVTRILQPSAGLTYTASHASPLGSRISDLALNGVPVDPAATYRVATTDFLIDGGDGFSTFSQGTAHTVAPGFDIDALASYIGAHSPVSPPTPDRITRVD
jgi:5'-nucleotidase